MFDGLFGPGLQLATSVDAHLDRMEKVLRIRAMLKDQEIDVTEYDAALAAILGHMNAELAKANATQAKADAEKEDK